jgi:hypothetical protein
MAIPRPLATGRALYFAMTVLQSFTRISTPSSSCKRAEFPAPAHHRS